MILECLLVKRVDSICGNADEEDGRCQRPRRPSYRLRPHYLRAHRMYVNPKNSGAAEHSEKGFSKPAINRNLPRTHHTGHSVDKVHGSILRSSETVLASSRLDSSARHGGEASGNGSGNRSGDPVKDNI